MYRNITTAKEKWEDVLNFILKALDINNLNNLNDENHLITLEIGLYLFSSIYFILHDELEEGFDVFIKNFKNYFEIENLPIQTRTIQVITEMLAFANKKEIKKFKDFSLLILQTSLKCLDTNDEKNVNNK
jgi:hypothetical protein